MAGSKIYIKLIEELKNGDFPAFFFHFLSLNNLRGDHGISRGSFIVLLCIIFSKMILGEEEGKYQILHHFFERKH